MEAQVGRATLAGVGGAQTGPVPSAGSHRQFLHHCSPKQCSFLEMRTRGPREIESPAQRSTAKMPTQDSVLRPCDPPNLCSAL